MAADIREMWSWTVEWLGPKSRVDYRFSVHGVPLAVAELKSHAWEFHRHPVGFLVAEAKWDALRAVGACYGIPSLIMGRHPDGIYWARAVPELVVERRMGGRTDRGDPGDWEPMVALCWDGFRPYWECVL